MKAKVYLDTSIISAYFDLKKPVRQLITQKWIENEQQNFELYISELVLDEIDKNVDDELKKKMIFLINDLAPTNLKITDKVIELAGCYRENILPKEENDTIHIAVASLNELNIIASWNFRHIVNWKTIDTIHHINKEKNYNVIEILTLENLGGDKYGNI